MVLGSAASYSDQFEKLKNFFQEGLEQLIVFKFEKKIGYVVAWSIQKKFDFETFCRCGSSKIHKKRGFSISELLQKQNFWQKIRGFFPLKKSAILSSNTEQLPENSVDRLKFTIF